MAECLGALASTINAGLADAFSQHRRVLRLSTPLGAEHLLAESLRGEEQLDRGFQFQVSALAVDAGIPLKSLIGQPALIELQTAGSALHPRAFHGYITKAELIGANGGFARYQLGIEPWTAFLALGRDSRVFQDMTVFDILDAVFSAYDGKGRLAPSWRFDIRDRAIYPQRSLVTQYQESDLAFAERLMSEEGLFYFFEHEGDADNAGLGSHTLVIADHNDAFTPNTQTDVRFTQPGAVMHEDSMDRWRYELRLQSSAIELTTWDYRAGMQRTVSSGHDGGALVSRDVPGAYAYANTRQGQRIADNHLHAVQARSEVFIGAGTVRTFIPGTTFNLHGHASLDADSEDPFVILRVCHLAHNNLNADTGHALERLLGRNPVQQANEADLATSLHATGRGAGERPVYRNRIDAIRHSVPYRPSRIDGQGRLLHPRPSVSGQQTAIVVGPPGAVIHTDRDHRIKIQFHWQRGDGSHSRLDHPSPEGHSGAPADDRSGTWVRVATPLAPIAGGNWGSNALPRVGQEVLVDFLDGNIDRPVVIGALYNGQGQVDAQHNQVSQGAGAVTANAPSWFPGEGGGHAHPAVLSGIKTQSMAASQTGAGAYNQLVFDDSPGQARVALQRHGKLHDGSAELNLGHLRHQSDNQRLQTGGFGAEIKTEHSAAVRAGKGMLLSTDVNGNATGSHIDSQDAAAQVEERLQMQTELIQTAHKHNAKLKEEASPAELAPIKRLAHVGRVLESMEQGSSPNADPDAGHATAYRDAHLQLSGQAGIAAVSPASVALAAGETGNLAAGQDINMAAQGNLYHAVVSGVGLFTYGKASASEKPNQETGIRLHAASGKVSLQSQSDVTRITADKAVTVASVTADVNISGKQHVMLTAQGAYLKLEGGNIMIHGPGAMKFKASMKELTGPASSASETRLPPVGKLAECPTKQSDAATGGASAI